MVHYTCDMCGKPLLAEEDTRYVVKIEVYTACDAIDMDEDIDEEIMEIEETVEGRDNIADAVDMLENGEYKTFRFDLCAKCHKKYLQDPLFLKSWRQTRFSEN
ncbi:MAG: hypothetical protein QY310_02030 [Candidatus Jettenia sp. CY-1]|nr:hypothetical protein [Candidatus Jettenia sp.]UJS16397.1 MAG: hypothetical protein L3J17_10775 [Candidatus Jettenia sp.]WKZ19350.1 MAG: hypothetical protein QY310_02030 [Candidatus Jettenia sp. CY-1]